MKLSIPNNSLFNEYLKWIKNIRNLADGTLKLYCYYLNQFIEQLGSNLSFKKLSSLSPEEIQTIFLDYSKNHAQNASRSMRDALRSFFRFCLSQGYIKYNLAEAIPTLRTYSLSTLPRGIKDNEAQHVLSNINRSTRSGKRNYAIIQMLYTYGVRGGQIRTLCFNDINWEQSKIKFPVLKHGKECILPLTDEVGESLLDYLQHSRPNEPYSEIFLTAKAPYTPLHTSNSLSKMVTRRIRAAGIKLSIYGSHLFRHCFASRMLKQKHSIKFIADMLGHRAIKTTFIYTKVDFQTLNQVPLEWPEEKS